MKYTHPGINYEFIDASGGTFITTSTLPLYRPLFVIKAQQGMPGELTWNSDYDTAVARYGEETFNSNNPDFHCRDVFMLKDALERSGAFIIRLDDDDMKQASFKLVTKLTGQTGEDPTEIKVTHTKAQATYSEGISELDNLDTQVVTPTVTLGTQTTETASIDYAEATELSGFYALKTTVSAKLTHRTIELAGPWDSLSDVRVFAQFKGNNIGNDSMPYFTDFSTDYLPVPTDDGYEDSELIELPNIDGRLIMPPCPDSVDLVAANTASATIEARLWIIKEDGTAFEAGSRTSQTVTLGTSPDAGDVTISGAEFTLFGFEADSAGAFGNNLAFDLAADLDVDSGYVDSLGAWPVRITFASYSDGLSTYVPYSTALSSKSISFVTDPTIIDPSTLASAGFAAKASVYYSDEVPQPFQMVVNTTHIKKFYETLRKALVARADSWEAWVAIKMLGDTPEKINPLNMSSFIETPETLNGTETYTAPASSRVGIINQTRLDIELVDDTSKLGGLSNDVYVTLMGGSDGALSVDYALDDRTVPENIIQKKLEEFWITASDTPLVDMPRSPFNYIPDSGHSMAVKLAMMNIYTFRKDVMPMFSAWDGSTSAKKYNEATAAIATSTLASSIRMYKASVQYGTKAYRAIIMDMLGYVSPLEFDGVLPHTAWLNRRLCETCGSTSITANIEGDEAECTMFTSNTFVPYKESAKAVLWGMAGNYAQHWSMEGIHYAGLRTVYEDETSLYSNLSYVNATMFLTQAIPAIWKSFASSTESRTTNYSLAEQKLTTAAKKILNGIYTFSVDIYQSVEDEASGISDTIDFSLYGENGQRIWNFNMIARRAEGDS